jgi:sulfur-carrier protein
MAIFFHIPGPLREFTGGQGRIEISGAPANVGEALAILWTMHPGVRDRVVTEQGQIREHIGVFVGDESIRYTGGLATPIVAGCEISIIPAVSGGTGSGLFAWERPAIVWNGAKAMNQRPASVID